MIGIFDSGLGGLSVLHEATKTFCDFLYYADRDNVPYGSKSEDEIINLSFKAVEFMLSKGCEAIVIACNTATSVAVNELRSHFDIPIIGMEPAIKQAVLHRKFGKILLIATPVTIAGKKLQSLINSLNANEIITALPLPKLVNFAENCDFSSYELREYLKDNFKLINKRDFESIVLGCTHFNYFKDSLQELIGGNIAFYDGNKGTVNRLNEISHYKNRKNGSGNIEFYYSGKLVRDQKEIIRINKLLARLKDMENI